MTLTTSMPTHKAMITVVHALVTTSVLSGVAERVGLGASVGTGVGVGVAVGANVGDGVGVGAGVGRGGGVGDCGGGIEAEISSSVLPPISQLPVWSAV